MNYRIVIDRAARKFILKQPPEQQKRLLMAIYKLPHEGDIKAVRGYEGRYRLRVGSYRVIYTIYEAVLTVNVLKVGNRGDVYK